LTIKKLRSTTSINGTDCITHRKFSCNRIAFQPTMPNYLRLRAKLVGFTLA